MNAWRRAICRSRTLGCAILAAVLALGLTTPAASRAPVAATMIPAPTPPPAITVTSGSLTATDPPETNSPIGRDASPIPSATQDPEAERDFARARAWWRARTDVPYVRYGALVRYLHDGHVFDNWWDVRYRSSDGALSFFRLVDVAEDRRRLGGVPFSIFGFKIFDTNKDAEPIRLDEPRIDPASSFGVVTRFVKPIASHAAASGTTLAPSAAPTDDLREIGRIESTARTYDIRIVGRETFAGNSVLHLAFVPLRDRKINRIRDLWLDPATFRTVGARVQGLLDGKPYDGIPWTIHYVLVEGRQYVQQIVADEPLRFGIDTTIPKFEFDFVDYRFPTDVPKYTFDRPF